MGAFFIFPTFSSAETSVVVPSLVEDCATYLTRAIAPALYPKSSSFTQISAEVQKLNEVDNLRVSDLLLFYDGLAGPDSATVSDLARLAGIKKLRWARLHEFNVSIRASKLPSFKNQTKHKTLVLPRPRGRMTPRLLGLLFMQLIEPLRLEALKASASPFTTPLPDYQAVTRKILGRSESQIYETLFILAPDLLTQTSHQTTCDLPLGDRRKLTRGRLPGFLKPSLDRAIDGWMLGPGGERMIAAAVGTDLNYRWFGDAESRVRTLFWRTVKGGTVACSVLGLVQQGPVLYSIWQNREAIQEALANVEITAPTPEELAEARALMNQHYLKKMNEAQAAYAKNPNAAAIREDLEYQTRHYRETLPR